ncbi:hypothetical protein GGS21DRAFT_490247 [Xylaria nigripes]|nr:hypothetical protein GGS21DRAFT_490247 [Xylaria nigripes]
MADSSSILEHLTGLQKSDCPSQTSFYRCGKYSGCCAADPCTFTTESDPCAAAVASRGGDGDGHGGDDSTSTNKVTSTQLVEPTATRTDKTSSTDTTVTDEPEPSTTDDGDSSTRDAGPTASSTESPIPTDPADSSSPADSTTFETTTMTSGTLPAPTSTAPSQNDGQEAYMSKSTVLAISIGSTLGGLALLALLFWLVRRRRLSKRMSSVRGDSPGPGKNPGLDRQTSLTGTVLNSHDIFAEFGGRYQINNAHPGTSANETGKDEGWPLSNAPSPEVPHQQVNTAVELDSTETGSAGPVANGGMQPRRTSLQGIVHPSPLTPGFPGTEMAIQQGSGRNANFNRNGMQYQNQYQNPYPQHNFPNMPRATLNATDDERKNNLYANSWAHGP